jgi:hypothetical protein
METDEDVQETAEVAEEEVLSDDEEGHSWWI